MQAIKAVTPYLYAGAVRSGTKHAVNAASAALAHAAADHPIIQEFLQSPAGDALLRLALAGALAIKQVPHLEGLQDDVKQELLVSASASGFDALFAGLIEGGRFLHEQLLDAQATIVETVATETLETKAES